MAKQADHQAARELQLYADNTFELYRQKQDIEANLERRVKRGTYDSKKAPKLWRYWMDSAAKRYHKEFGSGGAWGDMFNVPTREVAANSASKDWEAENLSDLKKKYAALPTKKKKKAAADTKYDAAYWAQIASKFRSPWSHSRTLEAFCSVKSRFFDRPNR